VEFCAGTIVTPEARPIGPQLIKLERKIEAGAEFFQAQAIYDLENFKRFMEYARKPEAEVPAGVALFSSARKAGKRAGYLRPPKSYLRTSMRYYGYHWLANLSLVKEKTY
jgi:5,10-methylenetetrahydrofolate reductase